MKNKFALCFLIFASLLFAANETSAQVKPDSKKDSIEEFWKKQRDKALEMRTSPTGLNPPGIVVPDELGVSIVKQKAKIAEMQKNGFKTPLDFADLADRILKGELVELPMATENYYLDVGSIVTDAPLTSFDFENGQVELKPADAKYQTLKKLADDFGGTKYDLNNPAERKKFKLRLLRTIAPAAKPVLEELAAAYQQRFKRPLRITSIARSMEYQIALNSVDNSSFLVRGAETIPPHTTGLAFDIAYKAMTAEEQNFLMAKMLELEKSGKIDGLREMGINAALHVFVYADGKPPEMK